MEPLPEDGSRGQAPEVQRIAYSSQLTPLSWLAALWALWYAVYRAYYALGGAFGMQGTPVSFALWRHVNAVGAALILAFAVLPVLLLPVWRYRRVRPFLLLLCWIVAVGCISHSLIDIVQHVASLAGALSIDYPFWQSIDRRMADLQVIFLNEPWFLIEGLLWATLAWTGALRQSPRRWWWIGSALAGVTAATTIGLFRAFGVMTKVIVG
jgi:hypothetical protein